MPTQDVSPKPKRQKITARQRNKEMRTEKLRAKRAIDSLNALLDMRERWVRPEQPLAAFTDRCVGCGRDILVTYGQGRMQHAHAKPVCNAYRVLEKLVGTESAPLDSYDDPLGPAPLPSWAEGPHAILTREEGDRLVDLGEVQNSCVMVQTMQDGSQQWIMVALTNDGLCTWVVIPPSEMDDDRG